jgi:hypothetical protein
MSLVILCTVSIDPLLGVNKDLPPDDNFIKHRTPKASDS